MLKLAGDDKITVGGVVLVQEDADGEVHVTALLAARGVGVHAVLTGSTDTDMTRGFDIPKASAASVARAILDGVERGEEGPAARRPRRHLRTMLIRIDDDALMPR